MNTKFLLILISVFSFAACSNGSAKKANTEYAKKVSDTSGETYTLSVDESQIHWRGTKPTGEHNGTVNLSEGSLTVKEGSVTGGTFLIDLNTIVNNDLENENMNAKLVGHLKSPDFFDVANYPAAKFEITGIKKYESEVKDGFIPTHKVEGNLTMKGITRNISFPAKIEVKENKITAISDEFSIDRTLWNVNFKSKKVFAELKDNFIGDLIHLKIKTEFTKTME